MKTYINIISIAIIVCGTGYIATSFQDNSQKIEENTIFVLQGEQFFVESDPSQITDWMVEFDETVVSLVSQDQFENGVQKFQFTASQKGETKIVFTYPTKKEIHNIVIE